MDIRLSGTMDGVSAATRISTEVGAPVVFLTGDTDADTLQRAKDASPYSYLIKPFDSNELRCAIEVSLHRHDIELKLREREREVAQLNAVLEERVAQRTADLEAANRELEAFSYSVAHDLRGPLRGIDGFTQLVLEQNIGILGDESCRHLQKVRLATQRMAKLIDDLLGLTKIVRSECACERVDMSAINAELDSELRAAHPGRNVEFINQPAVTASGDPTLLHAVLSNLLSNAWKFTACAQRATIEFGATRRGDELVCFVRDNGVGFDMLYVQQLFGVFQRLHSAREFPGTGIGLAIVQRAVQRHGGRAWAKAAPDAGATFWFTLGRQPEDASCSSSLSSSVASP
jgi:light-regulated signal transduction histidine kinase (bacteriophytochrome)